jgi:hypothetical protein
MVIPQAAKRARKAQIIEVEEAVSKQKGRHEAGHFKRSFACDLSISR